MIPLLTALLTPRPDLDRAQLLGRVEAFVAAARTGLDPETVLPPYPAEGERPKLDDFFSQPGRADPQAPVYDYDHAIIWVEAANGRVWNYVEQAHDGTHYNPDGSLAPRKVSDAQAIALARRFYAAAGWGESVVRPVDREGVVREAIDGADTNDRAVEVHLSPTAGGVRYDEGRWDCIVDVNRDTGELAHFSAPGDIPPPPASLVPGGPAEAARAIALRFAAARAGEPVAEMPTHPVALRLWLPGANAATPRAALARAYPPAVLAALDARRAMLVYQGTVVGSSWRTSANMTLDARTGEPLDVRPFPDPRSFGGRAPAAPTPSFDVPTDARPWRVATDGKGWDAWTPPVKAVLTPAESAIPTGEKLTLTDGKAAFPATYDPKANLLGIAGKAYRPGPALADLLKRRTKG